MNFYNNFISCTYSKPLGKNKILNKNIKWFWSYNFLYRIFSNFYNFSLLQCKILLLKNTVQLISFCLKFMTFNFYISYIINYNDLKISNVIPMTNVPL